MSSEILIRVCFFLAFTYQSSELACLELEELGARRSLELGARIGGVRDTDGNRTVEETLGAWSSELGCFDELGAYHACDARG
jgi:hypothetical protein